MPLTWEDEVRLLKRELARAWSSLKLEEQRNHDLPPMVAASSPEEYDAMANDAVDRIMRFLEDKNVVTVTDYMEPAMREHLGSFVPEDQRHFFLDYGALRSRAVVHSLLALVRTGTHGS